MRMFFHFKISEVDSGMRRSMCTYHSTFTPCSLDAFGLIPRFGVMAGILSFDWLCWPSGPTNELRELYKQQSRGAG